MDKEIDELEEKVNVEGKANVDDVQSSLNDSINSSEENKNQASEYSIENGENDENKSQKNEIIAGIGIALGSILGVVLLTLLVLVIAGFQFYYVLTGSMSPTISAGQTVLVNTNIDKYNLKVGDIVTFESGNITVTHRIIEVKEVDGQMVYVQAPDYVYQKEILGKDIKYPADVENAKQLHPDNVKGTVVTINGNPVKLIILGELIKMFRVPNALNIVKIILVAVIIGLIIWTIVPYVREKVGNRNRKE